MFYNLTFRKLKLKKIFKLNFSFYFNDIFSKFFNCIRYYFQKKVSIQNADFKKKYEMK